MKTETIIINKADIFNQVQMSTSYEVAKNSTSEEDWDRIPVIDEDNDFIERFFAETISMVSDTMKAYMNSGPEINDDEVKFEFKFSSLFDESLRGSMYDELRSLFITSVIAKWYAYANKPQAEIVTNEMFSHLNSFKKMAFHKKAPTRPEL